MPDEILQERAERSRSRRNPRERKRKLPDHPMRRRDTSSLLSIDLTQAMRMVKGTELAPAGETHGSAQSPDVSSGAIGGRPVSEQGDTESSK